MWIIHSRWKFTVQISRRLSVGRFLVTKFIHEMNFKNVVTINYIKITWDYNTQTYCPYYN